MLALWHMVYSRPTTFETLNNKEVRPLSTKHKGQIFYLECCFILVSTHEKAEKKQSLIGFNTLLLKKILKAATWVNLVITCFWSGKNQTYSTLRSDFIKDNLILSSY